MQKLGQHFLRDKKVLERIAGAIKSNSVKTIIEIGPGHGELTEKLIELNPKAKIISIEKDEKLVMPFEKKFFGTNATIYNGDALKILPKITEELKEGEYIIIGNIPYYITGFLFRVLGELPKKPKKIVLLIQKEVAERVVAEPPEMNRLSASVQFWGDPELLLIVPPGAFNPPPKVHSAVIAVIPKGDKPLVSEKKYYETIRLLFAQPRKTILNNLSSKISKKEAENLLHKLSIAPNDRPQNVKVDQIIEIARAIS